ncbi:hypothetical protein JCM10212_006954 [Sporobolomyces blumeae]
MLAAAAFVASMALASVQAAPISLNVVEAAVSTPNTTQVSNVVSYFMNGNAGACTWYNKDSDVVVGLPLEFYSNLGSVSPYCGQFVVVKNTETNKTTTALVADASTQNNTLSVSQGTWAALNGTATDLTTVAWRFANATETADAKAALADSSSSSSSAPSSTSQYVAPSSSSPAKASSSSAAETPAEVQQKQATSEAPSTTSYAPKTTSYAPKPTTTSYTPPKTTTTTYEAPQTTTQAAQKQSTSYGSYSGQATFYTQGGVAGSCGQVNGDYSMIVAMNAPMVDGGSHCGQWVNIKNTANGKTVTAKVADTCPGCAYGSLDLSLGAFDAIGSRDTGVLPITWSFA